MVEPLAVLVCSWTAHSRPSSNSRLVSPAKQLVQLVLRLQPSCSEERNGAGGNFHAELGGPQPKAARQAVVAC